MLNVAKQKLTEPISELGVIGKGFVIMLRAASPRSSGHEAKQVK